MKKCTATATISLAENGKLPPNFEQCIPLAARVIQPAHMLQDPQVTPRLRVRFGIVPSLCRCYYVEGWLDDNVFTSWKSDDEGNSQFGPGDGYYELAVFTAERFGDKLVHEEGEEIGTMMDAVTREITFEEDMRVMRGLAEQAIRHQSLRGQLDDVRFATDQSDDSAASL